MTGAELIVAERKRQVEVEGWTPEHDAKHTCDDLIVAAEAYLESARGRQGAGHMLWPWSSRFWKPKNRKADLIRAGALIAAEIDRLQQ